MSRGPVAANSDPSEIPSRRQDTRFEPPAVAAEDSPQAAPAKAAAILMQALFGLSRWLWWLVKAPLLAYLSLRRSLTAASVSILLASVMTLNVIWGFPWSGMMGGCLAMLMVGFAINRLMRPRLKLSVSLPRSAIAGQPFSANVRLANPSYFPALDLRVGWHREGVREIRLGHHETDWDASPPVSVSILRSGDQMYWHGSMLFNERGIHDLPPFQVASTFPFHLFHIRLPLETKTKIAITPAPASDDDDPMTRVMLAAIGDWSKQLVAGAPVEYVGNREYQVGVPVRRWDFASWARLGRPIVREYQSPSIQAVTLVVDTSQWLADPAASSRARQRELQVDFERLMSITATAISDLTSRRVQLKLFLTSESPLDHSAVQHSNSFGESSELMLVRLAAAQPMDPALAEKRIRETIDESRSQPVLVFSLFELASEQRSGLAGHLPPNVSYLSLERRQPTAPPASGPGISGRVKSGSAHSRGHLTGAEAVQ
ncbi:DUF58 domain-containing protein [Stieleria sp. TO1_6]|uniref:DUF58 domain-containing protein n=1 Tax=Stieleria tagensis TaxID=2956795 RepID=UPI00209B0036|nr:DUF58 domain-containing protein [Stieleria tagensis]MCO8120273.1 DUF58 domain-containing protein [Stieleria tagensis]